MDKEPFEEFDELLTPILGRIKTEARDAQVPPGFLERSMERIRQLPPSRREFSGVRRWFSWSAPSFVPALTVVAALVIAVPMASMYIRISHNEDRIRYSELQHRFTRMVKKDNDKLIRSRIGLSDNEEIIFCRPKKTSETKNTRLSLIQLNREFNTITFDEYDICDDAMTIIHLPESILNRLNIDKTNLDEQEILIYEDKREPEKGGDGTET